jgi:hypothetical protein
MSKHDHGPVEEKFRVQMQALGKGIDMILNPDGTKTTGFVVLMFELGTKGRMNYISNADRDDMLTALKELVARFEGRYSEPGNA